ncbi:hypothetical protein FGO68_gene7169 [Halteria grandinella]|uniref:Uncharacterized protein n=1 Tax=Halteria grandinella TaxID=5974 RepID=A0A8J8N9R3_HALGN|nr:hypothetical protein FGO68_gene7169 [Halteria grandinella]
MRAQDAPSQEDAKRLLSRPPSQALAPLSQIVPGPRRAQTRGHGPAPPTVSPQVSLERRSRPRPPRCAA